MVSTSPNVRLSEPSGVLKVIGATALIVNAKSLSSESSATVVILSI